MKFVALLVSAVAILPSAVQAANEAVVDSYLFDITLDEFETKRNAADPAEVNWGSDGCTDPPEVPAGFDFVCAKYSWVTSPTHLPSPSY